MGVLATAAGYFDEAPGLVIKAAVFSAERRYFSLEQRDFLPRRRDW
jgi:hypothetical protein